MQVLMCHTDEDNKQKQSNLLSTVKNLRVRCEMTKWEKEGYLV